MIGMPASAPARSEGLTRGRGACRPALASERNGAACAHKLPRRVHRFMSVHARREGALPASLPSEASLSLWPRRGPHACSPVRAQTRLQTRKQLWVCLRQRSTGQICTHMRRVGSGISPVRSTCPTPPPATIAACLSGPSSPESPPATRPNNWTGNGSWSNIN